MTNPRRQIPANRKILYYGGIALMAGGFLLFVSTFFTGPDLHSGPVPQPGEPDFWKRANERTEKFSREMNATGNRALLGMGVMVLGIVLLSVGLRGAAGSGLVLDPKKAREDMEPWSRMGGGMLQDTLSEVDVVKRLEERLESASTPPPPAVKVRCKACQALNDESAKFCSQCGAAV